MFDDFVIYSYSRKQAIEDGVLVDISEIAQKAGFLIHTAITSNLLSEIDAEAQLPVLLQSFHEKIKRHQEFGEMMKTETISKSGKVIAVYLHFGGGDNGEPVLTLMLPEDM